MYPIQEGDLLFKVTTYELYKSCKCLKIEVGYCLAGEEAGQFKASISCDGIDLSNKLEGHGESETAALRETLLKIQGLSLEEIVHYADWGPPREG